MLFHASGFEFAFSLGDILFDTAVLEITAGGTHLTVAGAPQVQPGI
jgi:hypothetical protein